MIMYKNVFILIKDLGMKCTSHSNLVSNSSAEIFHTHVYMVLERKKWRETQILKKKQPTIIGKSEMLHVLLYYSFNFSIDMKFIVVEG